MIDEPQQVVPLLKRLELSLPLPAIVTPELAAVIRERSSGTDPPRRCIITKTFYGGDEGRKRYRGRSGGEFPRAIARGPQAELIEVDALPPHRDLDGAVQLTQGAGIRY